jgi:hypothetical protein
MPIGLCQLVVLPVQQNGTEVREKFQIYFLSSHGKNVGGAEGDRTPDLMTASHALSQLSYGPIDEAKLSSEVKKEE